MVIISLCCVILLVQQAACRNNLKQKFGDVSDGDIVTEHIGLSLLCPLSQSPIIHPVRGWDKMIFNVCSVIANVEELLRSNNPCDVTTLRLLSFRCEAAIAYTPNALIFVRFC